MLNNLYFPHFSRINEITAIMASTYLKKYEKDINLEIWDTDINPINTKQQDLNGFLIYHMVHYIDSEYKDLILWYCMKEDFVK
jgi:hypothetical protein